MEGSSGSDLRAGGLGALTPLEEAPYELEAVLQELLATHPDLLAGDQMN